MNFSLRFIALFSLIALCGFASTASACSVGDANCPVAGYIINNTSSPLHFTWSKDTNKFYGIWAVTLPSIITTNRNELKPIPFKVDAKQSGSEYLAQVSMQFLEKPSGHGCGIYGMNQTNMGMYWYYGCSGKFKIKKAGNTFTISKIDSQ